MTRQPMPDPLHAKVAGRRLRYVRAGEGSPVIVFIGGAGMGIQSWQAVFAGAAARSTAFAYDRLDTGGSDRSSEAQSGAVIVATLRGLLESAGLDPPYLLVAHSLGGLFANLFARIAPSEVAGMVLVDAAHPDQREERERRRLRLPVRAATAALGLVDRVLGARRPSEMTSLDETRRQLDAAGPFPEIPLVVISGGKSPPSWLVSRVAHRDHLEHQRRLAALSPHGRQVTAERSGHFPQVTQPDLVLRAIESVIQQAR